MLKYIRNWWMNCKKDFKSEQIMMIIDAENDIDEIKKFFVSSNDRYNREFVYYCYDELKQLTDVDTKTVARMLEGDCVVLSRQPFPIQRWLNGLGVANEKITIPFHEVRCSYLNTNMYKDCWGNEIVSFGEVNTNIRLKGWCSKIVLKDGVKISGGGEFNIGSNCLLLIEQGCRLQGHWSIRLEDNTELIIGRESSLEDFAISVRARTRIGKNFRCGKGLEIIAEENNPIYIGDDVLLSSNVHIRSGNGHSLFDLTQQLNISNYDLSISIGNHVWVGQDVTIIGKTDIGNDCVVGAKSLVKITTESNKLMYGNPAKVGREAINWDYTNGMNFDEFCKL